MVSNGNAKHPWRELWTLPMFLMVWLPIAVITTLHFTSNPQQMWLHQILRRLYYLPIMIAAFQTGIRGGLAASLLTTAVYLPHAFTHVHHQDPAPSLEKALEIILYNVVALLAGYLAGQGRSRQHKLEDALLEQRNLQKQLVRAGRLAALGEVVAGIAHEVRNPIHSLKGSAEILEPTIAQSGDERKIWNIHRRELDRLDRVAERFLTFSQPATTSKKPIDLRDVAKHLQGILEAQTRHEALLIHFDLADHPVPVQGDLDQLVRLVLNIAQNGIRALTQQERPQGDNPAQLSIKIHRQTGHDARAFFDLENNGPMIAHEIMEQIFDPFFTDSEGGTGLGLSISIRIAEAHDGGIDVENTPAGVRFRVYLPISTIHDPLKRSS